MLKMIDGKYNRADFAKSYGAFDNLVVPPTLQEAHELVTRARNGSGVAALRMYEIVNYLDERKLVGEKVSAFAYISGAYGVLFDSIPVTPTPEPEPVLGVTLSIVSGPETDDVDPSIVLTLAGDTFAVGADMVEKWDVVVGASGLVFDSVIINDLEATLGFTGTAVGLEEITIQALGLALTGGVASDVVIYTVSTPN